MLSIKVSVAICVLCAVASGPPAYSRWIQKTPFVDRSRVHAFIPDNIVSKTLAAPPRKPTAISGSEFASSVLGLPISERESAMLRELLSGNIPNASRVLIPVRLEYTDSLGNLHLATVFAMSDYVRLLADQVEVDGVQMQISQALMSPELHGMFSNEGVLDLQEILAANYRPK